jgi:polygalacturonase
MVLTVASGLRWPLEVAPADIPAAVFRVTDYGGCAANAANCTQGVHAALAAAAAAGGGTVLFPASASVSHPAVYRSLPLDIHSPKIRLRVEVGATLLALCDAANWPRIPELPSYSSDVSKTWPAPFVGVTNTSDVVIDGGGTIDASGRCFWNHSMAVAGRSIGRGNLLLVSRSHAVEISGVLLTNSPFWTTHVWASQDVHLHNLRIVNPASSDNGARYFGPNTDGVDIDSSLRVLLEDSTIHTGDDCVVIKSGEDAAGRAFGVPTANVLVRNMSLEACSCFKHGHGGIHGGDHYYDGCGALKIGTEMSGGVANVSFANNTVGYAGAAFKLLAPHGRGGFVSNVSWTDTLVRETGGLVWLQVANSSGGSGDPGSSVVSGVTIRDVAVGSLRCRFAGIHGQPQSDCHHVGVFDFNAGEAAAAMDIRNVTVRAGANTTGRGWECTGPAARLLRPDQRASVSPPLPASCAK